MTNMDSIWFFRTVSGRQWRSDNPSWAVEPSWLDLTACAIIIIIIVHAHQVHRECSEQQKSDNRIRMDYCLFTAARRTDFGTLNYCGSYCTFRRNLLLNHKPMRNVISIIQQTNETISNHNFLVSCVQSTIAYDQWMSFANVTVS